MRLNHLNLPVDDLAAARSFFEHAFDFRCVRQAGDVVAVMADDHGFTLTLANARRFGGATPRYPEAFHVGFILDSPADVDAAYARLAAADVPLDRAPGRQHGDYGFYFTALNGILFEVQCTSRAED
ncbi:MAG TPA: VOC family protein [Thermomicrobiales bacterium]|nr:VOC family protein [Thermomicrobiales bacterium]